MSATAFLRTVLTRSFAVLALGLLLMSGAWAQRGSGRSPTDEIVFRFTLPQSKVTSAGVYNAQGNKVRELWGGRRLEAGTYTEVWDGKDDDGVLQPLGTYTIKVLHHNLRFEYSNLFNSGARPVGVGSYFQFGLPTSVRAAGSRLVWFAGYNEGGNSTFSSTVSNPTTFDQELPKLAGSHFIAGDGESDGTYVYVAANRNGYWGSEPQDSYLLKYSVGTGVLQRFTGLIPDGRNFNSADGPGGANYNGYALTVGVNPSVNNRPYRISKVAVMKGGNVVAVSQPGANRILFFDKNSGLQARAPLSVPSPTAMCWTKNNSNLLVVSNGTVFQNYRDVGASLMRVSSTDRRSLIVDMATDPKSGVVAAAYSNPIQQVIAYDPSRLIERWRLGKSGGYASTAIVATDRFHFNTNAQGGSISFQPDGKLWVYDRALVRMQRFTAPSVGGAVDATMTVVMPYTFAADRNDGSRLVANRYVGFRRDWTKTNRPGFGGGGAWTLDRFWGYRYVDLPNNIGTGIGQILSYNGRTFAALFATAKWQYVELTNSGTRDCGSINYDFGWDDNFNRITSRNPGSIQMEDFQGLNSSGNPVWGPQHTIAVFNASDQAAPYPTPGVGTTEFPMIGGKVVTSYNMNEGSMTRYHIGMLNPDGSWVWKQGKPADKAIPFPKNGRTTILGNLYGAQGVWAKDEFAILNWGGESYNGGQAGKHLIYNKDGLYVDQVGHSDQHLAINYVHYPAVGTNGNGFFGSLLYEGGKYRYLHTTESQSSGILEYTFENMDSYGVSSKSGVQGTTITMDPIPPMGQEPAAPGTIIEQDDFQRADSNTVGNGWIQPSAGLIIKSNGLEALPNVYGAHINNLIYRGQQELDSCQKIMIPPSFWSPELHLFTGNVSWVSSVGLAARIQTGTPKLLLGYCQYTRYFGSDPLNPDGNGRFYLDILVQDGSKTYSLAGLDGLYLDPAPGHAYSLRFVVSGTQPTRLDLVLWDETLNKEVLRDYTESWDPAFESAGYSGMSIGMGNCRVTRYEKRQFTWPVK